MVVDLQKVVFKMQPKKKNNATLVSFKNKTKTKNKPFIYLEATV